MKIKINILLHNIFSWNSHILWDNVEKLGGDRGATYDVTTWCIHVACWLNKATCMYAHAHAHAPGYPHARMHAHRPISNTYCFFTATMIRERVSMFRSRYAVCLVKILLLRILGDWRPKSKKTFTVLFFHREWLMYRQGRIHEDKTIRNKYIINNTTAI